MAKMTNEQKLKDALIKIINHKTDSFVADVYDIRRIAREALKSVGEKV